MSTSAPKKAKPARGKGLGILNPWGDLWTHNIFETEAGAQQYIRDFWSQPGFKAADRAPQALAKYRVVPVRVIVSIDRVSQDTAP